MKYGDIFRDQRDKRGENKDDKESGGGRRDGERGSGRIFRDKDRERERERDRQERGYGHERRGYRDGRDNRRNRDGRDTGHEAKRPIILAKPPANKEKELEKQRDEEFPTLQQAHHRDGAAKTPPPPGASIEVSRASEDRLLEVGKLLLGRHDSVGKSQNNSGAGSSTIGATSQPIANYATPPKATSPRPPVDDTLQHITSRLSEVLNMDDPPFREKVLIRI